MTLDCTNCGSCCIIFNQVPVGINETWVPRELLEETKPHIGERGIIVAHVMKFITTGGTNHCIGYDPVTKRCKIYENRPAVCRDFVPGCHSCHQARFMDQDKMDRFEAETKAWQEYQKNPVTGVLFLKKEYEHGCRRVRANGVWSPWTCFRCLRQARRIRDIRHAPDCFVGVPGDVTRTESKFEVVASPA